MDGAAGITRNSNKTLLRAKKILESHGRLCHDGKTTHKEEVMSFNL